MKRKKYSPEFKLKVVKEAIETGNNSLVARNHQLGSSMVSRWVRQYKAVGESNFLAGKTSNQQWNNKPFTEKEKKELAQENDRLKKLLGEKDLEIEILRDLLKKTDPHWQKKCKLPKNG